MSHFEWEVVEWIAGVVAVISFSEWVFFVIAIFAAIDIHGHGWLYAIHHNWGIFLVSIGALAIKGFFVRGKKTKDSGPVGGSHMVEAMLLGENAMNPLARKAARKARDSFF